jgi:hypothetical protein
VTNPAATKSAIAVRFFMTISFVIPFSGPVWSLDFVLSGECCYARIYCKRVAKPAQTPAKKVLILISNKIETRASIRKSTSRAHTPFAGIRMVPLSIRSVPATREIVFLLPIQLHSRSKEAR